MIYRKKVTEPWYDESFVCQHIIRFLVRSIHQFLEKLLQPRLTIGLSGAKPFTVVAIAVCIGAGEGHGMGMASLGLGAPAGTLELEMLETKWRFLDPNEVHTAVPMVGGGTVHSGNVQGVKLKRWIFSSYNLTSFINNIKMTVISLQYCIKKTHVKN